MREAPTPATRLRTAVIVSFLNEAEYLPTFLRSMEAQTRRPELLVLVDDGSTDASPAIADGFASDRGWVESLRRPPRPKERDRLATAAELKSFHWALEQIERDRWDVIVKMDADLDLAADHVETVVGLLERDRGVGIAGAYFAEGTGRVSRQEHPSFHVRGANKFYRRECLNKIVPIPPILGWDTIDDRRARMHGWRTISVELQTRDTLHLRPTGAHDGRLRAYRRWGYCAWGWGAHPLYVLAGAAYRIGRQPYVLAALNYLWGYVEGALRGAPQADPATKAYGRAEELSRLRRLVGRPAGKSEGCADARR
jgi:glycosyltransferase involved in cell wall biosynthesis